MVSLTMVQVWQGRRGLILRDLLLGATALVVALHILGSLGAGAGGVAPRLAGRAARGGAAPDARALQQRYLDTVKYSVTGVLLETPSLEPTKHSSTDQLKQMPYQAEQRRIGTDWPLYGQTMVGVQRLENVQMLLERVLTDGVAGDFVECGVWRGGTSLFARAILFAHGVTDRQVHLVDSFQGLPKASTAEDEDYWSEMEYLRVPKQVVQSSFQRYGLLDDQVQFHQGFFREALPRWRAEVGRRIAVLRLDGDMYESTMDEFYNLWDLVAVGGWVIIDDYTIAPCRKAVDEFRARHGIEGPVHMIDASASYFQKTTDVMADMEWYRQFNAQRTQ